MIAKDKADFNFCLACGGEVSNIDHDFCLTCWLQQKHTYRSMRRTRYNACQENPDGVSP